MKHPGQVRVLEPFIIPIEGRHAKGGLVFRGARGQWWYGAVRMADPAPIYMTLAQLGYASAKRET